MKESIQPKHQFSPSKSTPGLSQMVVTPPAAPGVSNPRAFVCSRTAGYGTLLAALLLTAGCSGRQSALDPAGIQAGRIGSLLSLYFWICVVAYAGVIFYLFWSMLRARRSPSRPEDAQGVLPLDNVQEKRITYVVLTAVLATIVLLFVMMLSDFYTGQAIAALGTRKTDNPLTVKLTGHQWWWEVHYEDPVPSQMVATANEIHIPVGRPIKFNLQSPDVIHSFWVPNLHGKKDLIPGHPTSTWLQADRAGTYYGQCAEFCGLQHAQMRLVIVAEPEAQFNAWLNAQRQSSTPPGTETQKLGQQVFLSSSCVLCHTIQGTTARATVGPNLTHLASRLSIAAGSRPNNRGYLGGWIVDPHSIKPGVRMPQNDLDPNDLQALLDYLENLK